MVKVKTVEDDTQVRSKARIFIFGQQLTKYQEKVNEMDEMDEMEREILHC